MARNLGMVTAYAYAVAGGYTGTEAEFEELLGNIADDLSQIENLSVTVTTLAPGSSATASYSNGVLALGIPRGSTGATGNGISAIIKTGTSGLVDTYTVTYTNGQTMTYTVTNGAKGDKGDPGDVSQAQLDAAVSDLKSDLDGVQYVSSYTPSLGWEQGSFNSGGGDATSAIRIRTKFIPMMKGTKIKFSVDAGYKYEIDYYDSAKTWLRYQGWVTEDYTVTASEDGYLRLLLGTSNNASISPSDSSHFVAVKTAPNTDAILTLQNDDRIYQQASITKKRVLLSLSWEQGGINGTGGISNHVERIRTPYIFVGNIDTLEITVTSGHQVEVDKYDEKHNFVSVEGFQGGTFYPDITDVSYIRLVARNSPATTSAITPDAGNTEVSCYFTSELAVLSGENDALVKNAKASLKEQVNYWMVAGSISATGADSNSNASIRFRTPTPAFVKKGTILALRDSIYGLNNHYFYLVKYDEDGNFVSFGDPTKLAIIDDDCYVRIQGRKGNNQAIDDAVIAEYGHDFMVLDNPRNLYHERTIPFRSIQHSGNYGGAPMNTIAGFKAGYNAGFRIQEFDVRLTSDNVWVCCHNATINATARNSDGSELATDVYVANSTYADLLQYDFGIYAGSQYAGTKIPTVEETLKFLKSVGSMAYIDIMSYPEATEEQIQNLIDLVANCGMIGNAYFLASGNLGGMNYSYWITNYNKNANIVFAGTAGRYLEDATVSLTGQNAVCLDMRCDLVDSTQISNAKTYGIPVEVYDVSTTAEIDALDGYITGVSSDNIVASEYLRNKALS